MASIDLHRLWLIAVAMVAVTGCGQDTRLPAPERGPAGDRLAAHTAQFHQRVEKVTDGVYSAIGFSLANSILIVSSQGNIVVDTTENLESAREIKRQFHEISENKILAVVYTHAHPDHVLGAVVFAEPGTRVIAHSLFEPALEEQFSSLQPVLYRRGMRQFGTYLPAEEAIGAGIGPFLRWSRGSPRFVRPTETVEDQAELTVAGERLVLLHMPGETVDQMAVWLPERRVLLCGDNYYPAFPNLYTIRGTAPRPVADWILSLDRMRALRPEFLVPSHGEPVRGADEVMEVLTAYRDAIQYVHDAVLRGANDSKTPDQLAAEIRLPPHLAARPELAEFYGKISWSVRAIYEGYLGWFDGNATNLDPLTASDRALKTIKLAGGSKKVLIEANRALESSQFQWAAELADMVLIRAPRNEEARQIKVHALLGLSGLTPNANARHYYQTQARELLGEITLPGRLPVDEVLADSIPLDKIFEAMPARLDPVASADVEMSVLFNITDRMAQYSVVVRQGVAEVREGPAIGGGEPDLVFRVAAKHWKRIALGLDSPFWALIEGRLEVDGGPIDLLTFGGLFRSGA